MDEYQASQRMITMRVAKGREPPTNPVSRDCAEAIGLWLKVRARVMANVSKEEDEGWLFISETGTRIDEGRFLRATKEFASYAGLSDNITLHSLRRYSVNRLAKHNLLASQSIAGHKDTKTTLIYTKIDPDFVRQQHEEVGVLRGILNSRRAEKRKRLA
jgi:site-specific recombinase XerC